MPRPRKWTKDVLSEVVKSCKSVAEVIRVLGLRPGGGTHQFLRSRIDEYRIDTSHFTGSGWLKGQSADTSEAVRKLRTYTAFSNATVFVKHSPVSSRKQLVPRLLRLGWIYKCAVCLRDKWRGNPLTLHLDHINGNHSDNRLTNLRFLCPNCHQQTETWGRRAA